MKNLHELGSCFLSPTDKFRLLGFVGGIPLSADIGGKSVLTLYLLLFIPIALLVIFRRSISSTGLTLIDKASAAYFLWALLGFGIYLFQAALSGGNNTEARIISALGTMAYAALPFLLGRFLCQSDQEIQSIFEGLIAGMILSCGEILAAYALQWQIDMFLARYEIGQRIPMVVGFFTVLSLSRKQPLLKLLAIVFLAVSLISLSETRVSITAFMISLLMALLVFGKIYGRSKVLVVMIAMLLATALATQLSAGLRYRTMLLITTADVWMSKEQRTNERHPNEQHPKACDSTAFSVSGSKKQHLADASTDMRVRIWKDLLGKVTDSPTHLILGYGQLGPSYIGDQLKYESGYIVQQYSAHNEYLDVFVRSGLVGVILYLAVYGAIISYAWKNKSTSPGSVGFMYYHMIFALLGVAIYGIFHETTRYPWFSVLFWLFAGILFGKNANGLNASKAK